MAFLPQVFARMLPVGRVGSFPAPPAALPAPERVLALAGWYDPEARTGHGPRSLGRVRPVGTASNTTVSFGISHDYKEGIETKYLTILSDAIVRGAATHLAAPGRHTSIASDHRVSAALSLQAGSTACDL